MLEMGRNRSDAIIDYNYDWMKANHCLSNTCVIFNDIISHYTKY
jgi:hypothetical protein